MRNSNIKLTIKANTLEKALSIISDYFNIETKKILYDILYQSKSSIFSKAKQSVVLNISIASNILENSLQQPINRDNPINLYVKNDGVFIKTFTSVTESEILLIAKKRGVDIKSSDIQKYLKQPSQGYKKIAPYQGDNKYESAIVFIADEMHLNGYLLITSPSNGAATPSYMEVIDLLNRLNIHYGIIFPHIKKLLEEEILDIPILIAKGQSPIISSQPYYREYYKEDELENHPKNTKNPQSYFSVKKGSLVLELTNARESVDGIDIFGQPILSEEYAISLATIEAGENILLENSTHYYAQIDGFITQTEQSISIVPALTINSHISHITGDIDVAGNLIINGDIKPGRNVQATGSIIVNGYIEGGSVKAGKFITVTQGVSLSKVTAGQYLIARYIEKSDISVIGDILIKQYIINSQVECSGYLLLYGNKASIIGGKLEVYKGVFTDNIGSERQNTLIIVGQDPRISGRLKYLNQKKQKRLEDQQKIQKQLEIYIQPQQQEKLLSFKQKLEEILKKIDQEEQKVLQYVSVQKLLAVVSFSGSLFISTSIELYKQSYILKENSVQHKTLYLENQQIQVKDYYTQSLEQQILDQYNIKKD